MWDQLSGIVPKAVVPTAAAWALANYFLIGPEVAARVVRVDHLPACEVNITAMTLAAAQDRAASITPPDFDPGKDIAAEQLRRLRDNPLMRELMEMGGLGAGEASGRLLEEYERHKDAAREAYDHTLARVQAETAASLAEAGSVCGCLADAAISNTRTEWSIFTGTLGFVRPSPLRDVDRRMADAFSQGRCQTAHEVAP